MCDEQVNRKGVKAPKCRVDGCDRGADYIGHGLCQKHYFRLRRNGTTDKVRVRRQLSRKNPSGYLLVYHPDHPLAMSDGFVYEHRKVVHDLGLFNGKCSMCHCSITWKTCHVDHIDGDITNNSESNLRPTCAKCNTWRNYPAQYTISGRPPLDIGGLVMTAEEWSRMPGVKVSGACIRHRLSRGMSVRDAVYSEKKTHKS